MALRDRASFARLDKLKHVPRGVCFSLPRRVAARPVLAGREPHRRNRFRARKARFWTPSRHGFSFFSPKRVEYRIEISPKRIRGWRNASILIRSEERRV